MGLSGLRTLHSLREDVGSTPGLAQGGKDPAWLQAAAKVTHQALLWLWCKPAATTPIGPLASELTHGAAMAIKRKKKKKKSPVLYITCIFAGLHCH